MIRKRSLTGIKQTGIPHIANYIGAIRPALALTDEYDSYYFIADYHALTAVKDARELADLTYEVAAAWLAMGLDPARSTIYRQSDIPEDFELEWILACSTPKGLMNRGHAYKAAVAEAEAAGEADVDANVNMEPVLLPGTDGCRHQFFSPPMWYPSAGTRHSMWSTPATLRRNSITPTATP